jgi:hypothetical protein
VDHCAISCQVRSEADYGVTLTDVLMCAGQRCPSRLAGAARKR